MRARDDHEPVPAMKVGWVNTSNGTLRLKKRDQRPLPSLRGQVSRQLNGHWNEAALLISRRFASKNAGPKKWLRPSLMVGALRLWASRGLLYAHGITIARNGGSQSRKTWERALNQLIEDGLAEKVRLIDSQGRENVNLVDLTALFEWVCSMLDSLTKKAWTAEVVGGVEWVKAGGVWERADSRKAVFDVRG